MLLATVLTVPGPDCGVLGLVSGLLRIADSGIAVEVGI